MADREKPLPAPIEATAPFWEGLRHGQVRIQHCNACDGWVWYPRHRCNTCLSDDLTWEVVSGAGTLHTFTIARQATHPAFADEVPQLLAVVELDQGVKLTSTLVEIEPEAVRIGQRLEPVFAQVSDDVVLLRFRPSSL